MLKMAIFVRNISIPEISKNENEISEINLYSYNSERELKPQNLIEIIKSLKFQTQNEILEISETK